MLLGSIKVMYLIKSLVSSCFENVKFNHYPDICSEQLTKYGYLAHHTEKVKRKESFIFAKLENNLK